MKKIKLISMLSIGFVGGGLLTLVPFVTTSCQETKTPKATKLIIEDSQNNQISIHTTLNHSDSHTFHCYDDLGGLPSGVSWSIDTSNDSISIDSSTGVLTWGNNLDPDDESSNEFTLNCSNGELTSEVYSVSIIVDQTPGNDICPNSWLQVSASGALSLKAGVNKNQIHKLVIPSQLNGVNVTSILEVYFSNCTSLTSIDLPNSLESIGTQAFAGCGSIVSLALTEIIDWSESTFQLVDGTNGSLVTDGSSRTNAFLIKSSDIATGIITPTCGTIGGIAVGNITIPSTIDGTNNITSIGIYAFAYCSSLTSITLPNYLISIGTHAFSWCTSLTSLTLPNSLTGIASSAFSGCSSLTSIALTRVIDWTGSTFQLVDGTNVSLVTDGSSRTNAFLIKSNDITTGIITPTCGTWGGIAVGNITIPSTIDGTNNITSIGDSAFYNCTSLTSLTLPDSLTNIGGYAFQNCYSLTSLTLPNSLEDIGIRAFAGCSSLTSITATYDSEPTFTVGSDAFLDVPNSGTVENTGSLPSQDLLDYLKTISSTVFNAWTAV